MARARLLGTVESGGLRVNVHTWGNRVTGGSYHKTVLHEAQHPAVEGGPVLVTQLGAVFPSGKTEVGIARSRELLRLIREVRAGAG